MQIQEIETQTAAPVAVLFLTYPTKIYFISTTGKINK
jgi:hypothetical protein